MTDADGVFVDTNVWIYASVPNAPLHQRAREALDGATTPLWTSRQVLREFLAVMSRPQAFFTGEAPIGDLIARVQLIETRCRIARTGRRSRTDCCSC